MTQYNGKWMSPAEAAAARQRDADRARYDNEQKQTASAHTASDVGTQTGASWTVDNIGRITYGGPTGGTGSVGTGSSGVGGGGRGRAGGQILDTDVTRLAGTIPPPPGPVAYSPLALPRRPIGADGSMADTAGFARAKDRVGQTTRASMNSLRDVMAERGIQGAGMEADLMGDIAVAGMGELGEFDREAAIRDFDRQNQVADVERGFSVDAATMNAAGRNQVAGENAGRVLTARGQDVSLQNNRIPSLEALARLRANGILY